MVILTLTRGKKAIVDDEDITSLSVHNWCIDGQGRYAVSRIKGRLTYMHRLLMKAKQGEYIDHVNGNTLDNQKKNLRITTNLVNSNNLHRSKGYETYKSGSFAVRMMHDGRRYAFGIFDSAAEASHVYKTARKQLMEAL